MQKKTWCILSVTEHFCLQYIVNHENRVLQAEVQYTMNIKSSLIPPPQKKTSSIFS